jgi:hypothetical protein
MLPAYAEGARAVEAFYRSIPYIGWMNLYIGDPLLRAPHPVTRTGNDRDGDGIADESDNCSDLPNPEQRDSNGDGFGNLCDADLNGDGIVSTSWGSVFPMTTRGDLEWIALAAQNGPYDADADLNGDGQVDGGDLAIAQMSLFLAPGPSGQTRAAKP